MAIYNIYYLYLKIVICYRQSYGVRNPTCQWDSGIQPTWSGCRNGGWAFELEINRPNNWPNSQDLLGDFCGSVGAPMVKFFFFRGHTATNSLKFLGTAEMQPIKSHFHPFPCQSNQVFLKRKAPTCRLKVGWPTISWSRSNTAVTLADSLWRHPGGLNRSQWGD